MCRCKTFDRPHLREYCEAERTSAYCERAWQRYLKEYGHSALVRYQGGNMSEAWKALTEADRHWAVVREASKLRADLETANARVASLIEAGRPIAELIEMVVRHMGMQNPVPEFERETLADALAEWRRVSA